jgi:TonB family protein
MMLGLVVAGLLVLAPLPQLDPAAEFAAARALYASAAYEDALWRLARLSPATGPLADEVDTYRALCLLALGRTDESARVLEQIVVRSPSYALDETQVSPRLVAQFREVRARVLPFSARAMYAIARESFDRRQYQAAAAQLRELLRLIDPAAIQEPWSGLADLRVLAEGFLKLADEMAAGAPPPAPTSTAVMPPMAAGVASPGPVYSNAYRDVVAPVEIRRQVPLWEPPPGTPQGTYQGLIEVVINEQGRVESAAMRKSVAPTYDAALLASTAEWRFQPAVRDGVPVKFRRSYEVIVHSR